MKKTAVLVSMLVAIVLLAPIAPASAKSDEPDWWVDETSLPFEALEDAAPADQYWGVHTNAGYRIEVPENWNGDLIMWTHGYRGEDSRLFFNESEFPDGYRAWMLDQGYAWAASTYSKNSYNVATGVKDTHALSRRFNGIVGKPDNIYVAGYSMGGHIAAVSAETYGRTYSGAMPLCGVVGDFELFDYFLDLSLSGQQLALGASSFPVADDYLEATVPTIKDALGMNPDPASWFLFGDLPLTSAGEQYKQLLELRSGGDRPNFDEAFNYWNSIPSGTGLGNFLWEFGTGDGTVGGSPGVVISNDDVVYQLDLDPAISDDEANFNDSIARVSADPQGRKRGGLTNPPQVTGDLKMPVLTLHNLGDLFVPFHNEVAYAQDAADQGKSDLLVQRAIRGVSHCGFTSGEMIEGMSDLIAWAETGVRPEGDVVLDPAVVASENYGCAFTRSDDGGHTLATPCP